MLLVLTGLNLSAQTSCQTAQPFCAGGSSGVTFPATVNGPAAQTGPNYGCLGTQPNPAWYYLQISQSGNLDILIAGQIGNGPGQDVDFIAWGPFSSLANVCNSLTAGNIVDCSYSGSPTETLNIVNAVAGQYYMVLITNYANVTQNIVFNQYAGTGSTNCALLANNSSICAGNSATIVANNSTNLSNPTYSLNPGGVSSPNATFVVTPTVTTTYTVYVTGLNNQNQMQTVSATANVTVNPQPQISPSFTQATCSNSINAVNLGLSFTPSTSNYTVTWNPLPGSSPSGTQSAATNLQPGTTNVTVTAAGGCSATTSFTMGPVPGPVSFTISPPGGIYSVTCASPSVNLTAAPANYNYTWTSLSNTFTGTAVSLSSGNQGVYTVTAVNPITGCTGIPQTFTLGINTTVPTSTVNPINQVITCNSSPATFTSTALSPTVNVSHEWYSPLNPYPVGPPVFTSTGVVSIYGVLGPGTYTVVVKDNVNGCVVTKTINVTSVSGFPGFNTSSTSNYSLGCTPLNQSTLCAINATSTSGPVQYLFLPPGTPSSVPIPSVAFGAQSCTMVSVPGAWTVVVQDPINGCQTALSVPILQNTVAPNVAVSYGPGTQTLTCFTPTILATGSSSTTGAIVSWNVPPPATPPTVASPTVILGPPNGPNTSPTSTVYANYTVMVTSTVNACTSQSIVVVNQNFIAPTPSLAAGNPSVINCSGNPVILSFTNNPVANAGIPGATATVVYWQGPSPQVPLSGSATYSALIAGTYTLAVQNSKNGCIGTKTYIVPDMTQPPVIANPFVIVPSGCGDDASLTVNLAQSLTGWKLFLRSYPVNASVKPPNIIQPVNSPTYTGVSGTFTVDLPGQYQYVVTNMLTGCTAIGLFSVIPGGLNAGFTADPVTGFAPLSVGFNNTSATSTGATSSITSVWNFGNGTSSVTANTAPNTTYNAPGSYTVSMIATRGGCIDTAYQVIKVEIPSKLDIPNVFTPNGDGSNDLFFLKTQNLTDISASIFDRWGNLVYEVSSATGNIGWDGKNQGGKECPSGTYFYIIKSTGKDGKAYDQKGNVSLYR